MLIAASILFSSALFAATYFVRPGDDLRRAVAQLAPGDTLFLHGGRYQIESLRIDKQGTPQKYIVIAAAPQEQPILTAISTQHNLISIRSAAYVIISGLTLDGTPPNVDGVKFEHGHASHDVIIQNCEIKNFAGVGINSKGEDHHITVRDCHIHHSTVGTGEAFYIGAQDGSITPHHWTIAHNLIHDTAGQQGDGIELKYGVHSSIVRDNVVFRTQYPAILCYGVTGDNTERSRSNLIEGNVVFEVKEGIGGYADAIVRNNIVFDCAIGYQSRPHRQQPRNVEVYNNTFYQCGVLACIGWREAQHCVFVNNAAYQIARGVRMQGTGIFANNVSDFTAKGFRMSVAEDDMVSPRTHDFYPKASSHLRDAADARWQAPFDFNHQPREQRADIGAYEWRATRHSSAPLTRDFKRIP